jgi:hypothetical protein
MSEESVSFNTEHASLVYGRRDSNGRFYPIEEIDGGLKVELCSRQEQILLMILAAIIGGDGGFTEGLRHDRPHTLSAPGFYYATDEKQLYLYSPTNGWRPA